MAAPTAAEKAQRDWDRLVDKLAGRALRGQSIYMLPREVQTLVAAMNEVSTQAMLLQKFITMYPDLWANLVETLNVQQGSDDDRGELPGHDGERPGNVQNAADPEGPRAVAGGTDG